MNKRKAGVVWSCGRRKSGAAWWVVVNNCDKQARELAAREAKVITHIEATEKRLEQLREQQRQLEEQKGAGA